MELNSDWGNYFGSIGHNSSLDDSQNFWIYKPSAAHEFPSPEKITIVTHMNLLQLDVPSTQELFQSGSNEAS